MLLFIQHKLTEHRIEPNRVKSKEKRDEAISAQFDFNTYLKLIFHVFLWISRARKTQFPDYPKPV